jgi:hypothetical protein
MKIDTISETLRSNAAKRDAGQAYLDKLRFGSPTQIILPAKGCDISAPAPTKAGLRPAHDLKHSNVAPAMGKGYSEAQAFRRALKQLGAACAAKRARRDSRAIGKELELSLEAQSAAVETLANLMHKGLRLPALGLVFHRRKINSVYANAWRLARRAGHKAVDRALRKMAHGAEAERVAESTANRRARGADLKGNFALAAKLRAKAQSLKDLRESAKGLRVVDVSQVSDLLVDASDHSAQAEADRERIACAYIRLRSNGLRDAIRDACAVKKTRHATQAANAMLRNVDLWESLAIARARGEVGCDYSPLTGKPVKTREVSESLEITDGHGRPVAGGGTRKTKTEGTHEVCATGWIKWGKILAFIGEAPAKPRLARELSDEEKAENYRLSAFSAAKDFAAEKARRSSAPIPAPRASLRSVSFVRDCTMGGKGKSFAVSGRGVKARPAPIARFATPKAGATIAELYALAPLS